MAGPKYVATNLLASASAVSVTSTATGSAVASLYSGRPSNAHTSGATTADQRINVDHGSLTAADFAALINHNFPAGSTVTVEGYTASPPPASGAWSGAVTLGTFTIRAGDMWLDLGGDSYRYRSFYLQNDGGSTWSSGEPKVGEAVLGASVQLTRAFRWGTQRTMSADQIRHQTPAGQVWLARRSPRRKTFSLSWQVLSQSQLEEIEALHLATADAAVPCVIVPYPDVSALAAEVYMVEVDPALSVTDIHTANKSAALTLRELAREIVLS